MNENLKPQPMTAKEKIQEANEDALAPNKCEEHDNCFDVHAPAPETVGLGKFKKFNETVGYRWVILEDYLANPKAPKGSNSNAVGVQNYKGDPNAIDHNKCSRFEMYDDDGELYYMGIIVGDFNGFEPLDDFGTPNAGCTSIKIDGKAL